jgi:heterodisulfide reductase subunit A-like polyferredoxin
VQPPGLVYGAASQTRAGLDRDGRRISGGGLPGSQGYSDCVAQAGAAAAEAMAMVDKGHVELEPNTACINPDLCCGCRTVWGCAPTAPFAWT